jgi:hypothetical protein
MTVSTQVIPCAVQHAVMLCRHGIGVRFLDKAGGVTPLPARRNDLPLRWALQ